MENAYKLDKAHIHPDDMSKSTWVLVLAGTVRGSKAVAWVVQLPWYQMVAKRIHYKQTKDHFANGVFVRECEILIENHCGIFTL